MEKLKKTEKKWKGSALSKEYILSPDELRSLQMVLLEMLLELDRICKLRNIKYCIFAGTMLGAVRHGGFIPWDDDLDVAMMRAEYIKLRDACKNDLDESRFFFQDNTTDPHYRWGYGRIRRKNSEFVRVGQEHMKMHTGIFLDIFPLDGVPEFAPLRGMHNFYCFILRKLLYAEAGRKTGKTALTRAWYSLLNKVPHTWTFRRVYKLTTKWKSSRLVRHLGFPQPKGRVYGFNRVWFEVVSDVGFEGYFFPGNLDYDSFLTYHYGDYMQIPPSEKRHWHPVSKFMLPIVTTLPEQAQLCSYLPHRLYHNAQLCLADVQQ